MGTDAISSLACAAAQTTMEKQAGSLQTIGRWLEQGIPKLFTSAARNKAGKVIGRGGLSLPRIGLTTLGATGAHDVLSGMQGGWEGEGGMNWHPWSDPKNWFGNIVGHPVRSLRELAGYGTSGPTHVNDLGKPTTVREGNQLIEKRTITPRMSPEVLHQQEQMKRLKEQYEQMQKQLQSYNLPGSSTTSPAASQFAGNDFPQYKGGKPHPLDPPDTDYRTMNLYGAPTG